LTGAGYNLQKGGVTGAGACFGSFVRQRHNALLTTCGLALPLQLAQRDRLLDGPWPEDQRAVRTVGQCDDRGC